MKSNGSNPNNAAGMRRVFRALRHRNYRLFFSGQSVSLTGTWMTRIATGWLVYRITKSVFLLGVVGFASQVPSFLLAPFAGVLIDRWDRHRILIFTQTLSMLQSFAMAILAMTGVITVLHIIVLNAFQGLVNAVDMPARQSFVIEMIEDKGDLGNAIALNSSIVNGARMVGPSIAGILIATVGEGMCFLIDGISYIAVISALLVMKIVHKKTEPQKTHVLHGLKEGFTYAFSFAPIRSIILLLALISFTGVPYRVLMPVFAKGILHKGPHIFGFLMTASGIGALTGASYLASRKSVIGLEKNIALSAAVFGIGLIVFSISRTPLFSILLMLFVGFGMMVQMAASNTVLQSVVDDDKRGRVMSFYAMAFVGMSPFGNLLAGGLASRIGVPDTLLIAGGCCILGSLIFATRLSSIRDALQQIYTRKGLIPGIDPETPIET